MLQDKPTNLVYYNPETKGQHHLRSLVSAWHACTSPPYLVRNKFKNLLIKPLYKLYVFEL